MSRELFVKRLCQGVKIASYPCGCSIEDRRQDRYVAVHICKHHDHATQQIVHACHRPPIRVPVICVDGVA